MIRIASHFAAICILLAPQSVLGASFSILRSVYVPFPNPGLISADGQVAAGVAVPGNWIWTAENASQGAMPLGTYHNFPLPPIDLSFNTEPNAISANGEVIAGTGFRFSTHDGYELLEAEPVDNLNVELIPTDMSADGSVIVGFANLYQHVPSNWTRQSAFRWTRDQGVQYLSFPAGARVFNTQGTNIAVSDDGSTMVGTARVGLESEPFRWTEATGVQLLGNPPSLSNSRGMDISGDGSVLVGDGGNGAGGGQGFRWTQATGFEIIQPPDGTPSPEFGYSFNRISSNANVIVGARFEDQDGFATYWDPIGGLRLLETVAAEHGIDLQGHRLHDATAVSGDGKIIIGSVGDGHSYGSVYILDLNAPVPEPAAHLLAAIAFLAFRHKAATGGRGPVASPTGDRGP